MRLLPVNLDAILVELADLDETLALFDALEADPIEGVTELVPAARTILVHFLPWVCPLPRLVAGIAVRQGRRGQARQGTLVRIPVRYDGEDLAEMADHLGLSVEELVRRHAASVWQVAFTGFAPGFAYLSGGDPVFNVPRRASPRTRIPAGSVGLAGTFSAVYPRATPGGWQLIGTTDVPMWDLARTPPALLQPGQRVQFVDVATEEGEALQCAVVQQRSTGAGGGRMMCIAEDSCEGAGSARSVATADDVAGSGQDVCRAGDETAVAHVFEVVATGLQALFQDAGRPGQVRQGVSASGALDATAFRVANQLLGNEADATVIELVHGGFALRALTRTVVAVTGAIGPLDLKDASGVPLPAERHVPLAMEPGDVLTVGAPERGLRSYLAVRGGFDVAPVLGSSATDTLAGVGPEPLHVGQGLAVGQRIRGAVDAAEAGMAKLETLLPHLPDSVQSDLRDADAVRRHAIVLDLVLGPRTDWFDDESLELLQQQCWQVTQQSNRVGLKLLGEKPLQRVAGFQGRELPSEGTALGALQVPANGQPVLFLADHPLTGGYPVIGCVAPHHLDLAAQLPPGVFVRFKLMAPFAEIPLEGAGT
jgi:allophanate hydrolase subunit 2